MAGSRMNNIIAQEAQGHIEGDSMPLNDSREEGIAERAMRWSFLTILQPSVSTDQELPRMSSRCVENTPTGD
jgi:hypothetical protein